MTSFTTVPLGGHNLIVLQTSDFTKLYSLFDSATIIMVWAVNCPLKCGLYNYSSWVFSKLALFLTCVANVRFVGYKISVCVFLQFDVCNCKEPRVDWGKLGDF